MTWEYDFDKNLIIILFSNSSGVNKVIYRDTDFDFGTIILLDPNKSINELIKNSEESFSLLDKKGIVYVNYLDQIMIKGWGADEFINYQKKLKSEKKSATGNNTESRLK